MTLEPTGWGTRGYLHELDCEGGDDCSCSVLVPAVVVDYEAERNRRIAEVAALDPEDSRGRLLLNRAYQMRLYPTRAEAGMGAILEQSGYEFLFQEVLGQHIVDYFCPLLNLIVEVDGSIHRLQQEHDARRERVLSRRGHHGIRFTNDEVLNQPRWVLEELSGYCYELHKAIAG